MTKRSPKQRLRTNRSAARSVQFNSSQFKSIPMEGMKGKKKMKKKRVKIVVKELSRLKKYRFIDIKGRNI